MKKIVLVFLVVSGSAYADEYDTHSGWHLEQPETGYDAIQRLPKHDFDADWNNMKLENRMENLELNQFFLEQKLHKLEQENKEQDNGN